MPGNSKVNLSMREQQMIALAAEGFTDTAIAHQLGISEATVGTYWGRVRSKVGPYGRVELVARLLREDSEETVAALRAENERLKQQLQDPKTGIIYDVDFCKTIADLSGDGILMVTQNGKIVFVNASGARIFGYSEEEMTQLYVRDLIPIRLRESHDEHVRDFHLYPSRRVMGEHLATIALRSDGTEFIIAASLAPIQIHDDTYVICTLRSAESFAFSGTRESGPAKKPS